MLTIFMDNLPSYPIACIESLYIVKLYAGDALVMQSIITPDTQQSSSNFIQMTYSLLSLLTENKWNPTITY